MKEKDHTFLGKKMYGHQMDMNIPVVHMSRVKEKKTTMNLTTVHTFRFKHFSVELQMDITMQTVHMISIQ